MNDKYNITKEQNIFLAKRCIVDSIWKSSHIEGIDVTYPETQRIYDIMSLVYFKEKIKQFLSDNCIDGIVF